jgi:CubicO group peptidase (beta-lactamase class C family)
MPEPLSEEGLARFGEVAASHVGDDAVPGLVALVACGEQVHVSAHGSLSIGGPALRRDSQFRIASTTKPITAATTLALVGEGRFDLDEPVDRLLPELARRRVLRSLDAQLDDTVEATRPVTVRDLLTFTFGFGMALEMFASPEPWPVVRAEQELGLHTLGPPNPAAQPDPDTWIANLGSLPLLSQPGERWLYNTGASVLGVLLARAAGEPLGEVYRTRLLEPLGMHDTAFFAADTSRLGTTYAAAPGGLVPFDEPDGQWSKPPTFGDAAAGLVSTADDLLAFARMLLRGGKPVLDAGAVAAMTSEQVTPQQIAAAQPFLGHPLLGERSWGFCQAVATRGPHAGAFGWDGGLGTSWLVDARRDLVVIVLTGRMFESAQLPQAHADLQAAAYAALS